MITHEIDLNVGQPNNKQFIHINQGEYDSVKIVAHIWNKNKPYTIDADKIRIEGKLSSGALLFDGDTAIQIVKENDTTVSFILTKPIAASVGSFNFSLLFYKGSDVLKKTFPFTIRVSGNPANNVKSDAVLDGVIKKLEEQEQEYNQLAKVAKTGDYNDLINTPTNLKVTTNVFSPSFTYSTSGIGCSILLNDDYSMTVNNRESSFQTIKIGTIHVKSGVTYKVIFYDPNGEDASSVMLGINNRLISATEDYTFTPEEDGVLDVNVCPNGGIVRKYTIYPMVTTNLSATFDDYVPYTGDYPDINWDVSDLSRGFLHNDLSLGGSYIYFQKQDLNDTSFGEINYDNDEHLFSFYHTNTASDWECTDIAVGDVYAYKGKFWTDVIIDKPVGYDEEKEETIFETISLYDFYHKVNSNFDAITTDLSKYLLKAGDEMTGSLKIKDASLVLTNTGNRSITITQAENVLKFTQDLYSDIDGAVLSAHSFITPYVSVIDKDIYIQLYDTQDDGSIKLTNRISVSSMYSDLESAKIDLSKKLPLTGGDLTGTLRIVEDGFDSDDTLFAITPDHYISTLIVKRRQLIFNGDANFDDYQSPSNTFSVNTSNIKFWKTLFAKGNNSDEITVTLPSQTGTLALVGDIPTDYLHCTDGIVSDEVYFNNIVYFGDKKNNASIEYDKDTNKVSIRYIEYYSGSHDSGSSIGLADMAIDSLEASSGEFTRDVKLCIPVLDDEGNLISTNDISMKKMYNDITKLQTGLDGKLSLTGGTLTGDLYTTARIFFGTEDKNIGIVANIGNTASSTPTLSFTSDCVSKQPVLSADGFVTANSKISDDDIIHYMTKNGKRTKISLRSMYSDINTVVSDVEKKLPLAGGDLTGKLRIITDDFDEDEDTFFSIQPRSNTAKFMVNRSNTIHNGNFEFNNYQSSQNTLSVLTSHVKFWNTELLKSDSTDDITLQLPNTSGTIALTSDIHNTTICFDQFGQIDAFNLNQASEKTIKLVHDDSKLDVAGGTITGYLTVNGVLTLDDRLRLMDDQNTFEIIPDDIGDDRLRINYITSSGTSLADIKVKDVSSNIVTATSDIVILDNGNTISLRQLAQDYDDDVITAEDVETTWNKIFEEVS